MKVVIDDATLSDLAAIYVRLGDRSPDSAASSMRFSRR
jgi:hypothetical protein